MKKGTSLKRVARKHKEKPLKKRLRKYANKGLSNGRRGKRNGNQGRLI